MRRPRGRLYSVIRAYGPHPDQHVHRFDTDVAPRAVVALFHGGFWRARYTRELMEPLCHDLVARGYEAWNVEYRRIGAGGGWPTTFDDVARAVEGAPPPLVTVGHSAGGQLALWVGAKAGAALAVSQAGVVDLDEASRLGLSNHAVHELLGGSPDEVPDRYAAASPAALLPLGVGQLLVHGRRDDTVPISMSHAYRERAAAAGDDVELVETDEGHMECLDPESESWRAIVERLP
jgi:acetyl esterase/lipase